MSQEIQEEQQEQIRQQVAQDEAENFNSDSEVANHGQIRIKTRKTPEELEQQREIDSRSIFIGNVDYNSTTDEIEEYFKIAGTINRVTILFNHFTGLPKGHAYVEYENAESVSKAVEQLNSTEFKGRTISVIIKRTNLPGLGRRGGFRGGRAAGRGRGGNFRGGRGNFRGRGGRRGGRVSEPGREGAEQEEVENVIVAE